MYVLSESITRILVSVFYTVKELHPPHMNSVISCFWIIMLRWLTLICFERIYWLHNHPSLRCVRKKKVLKYSMQAEIIHSIQDLFAVVLKFLCILTAQNKFLYFYFFLVVSFFLFLLLLLLLFFGILFSLHCYLLTTTSWYWR